MSNFLALIIIIYGYTIYVTDLIYGVSILGFAVIECCVLFSSLLHAKKLNLSLYFMLVSVD